MASCRPPPSPTLADGMDDVYGDGVKAPGNEMERVLTSNLHREDPCYYQLANLSVDD